MTKRIVLLIAILVSALCGCSDDDNALAPEPADVRHVDADRGADSGDGSSSAPWATITHAVATAGEGFTIYVAPATYDVANGETFPIRLKPGQKLIGDVVNQGLGTTPTRVQGEGVYAHGLQDGAVIVGAGGARVAGFAIVTATDPNFYSGIAVDTLAMEIDHNTFEGDLYAGVGSTDGAAPVIHDNHFSTRSYGLYMDGSGAAHVHDNVIEATAFGIRYFGATGLVIEDNWITATSVGVQAGFGSATIRNNRFESTAYSYGAIAVSGPTPVIRGNWFAGGPALNVEFGGNPDAGTLSEPGANDFSDITGVVVRHTGSGIVTVIGNTWANYPPQLGTDIVITGTGSVVWE